MSTDLKLIQPIKLIGLHGHAGVGKDTVGEYLRDTFLQTYVESFAEPLKTACAAMFGIEEAEFYDRDQKELINPAWNVSPRMIAQFVGTELVRNRVDNLIGSEGREDFWIKRLAAKINGQLSYYDNSRDPYTAGDTVVITDVRFQNEYNWIIDNGGIVIHLIRPGHIGAVGITSHASEHKLFLHAMEKTYELVNDHTLEALYGAVNTIVNPYYFEGI